MLALNKAVCCTTGGIVINLCHTTARKRLDIQVKFIGQDIVRRHPRLCAVVVFETLDPIDASMNTWFLSDDVLGDADRCDKRRWQKICLSVVPKRIFVVEVD